MDTRFLPVNGLLTAPEEGNAPDSFEGLLHCSCGCDAFRVLHSGQVTGKWQRLWAANLIKPADGQPLVIAARCNACGKAWTLHCTAHDAKGWLLPASPQLEELALPKVHDQPVQLDVWYCWDEDAEQQDGQYLTTYTLFSLFARADGQSKPIHICDINC